MEYKEVSFSVLAGLVLTSIEVFDDFIRFTTDEKRVYVMRHEQNCCEEVYIEDICGDIEDLLNTPILRAEEVTNKDCSPEGKQVNVDALKEKYCETVSYTWTFYKLDTMRGGVTIRWFGHSNGYYAERAALYEEIDY